MSQQWNTTRKVVEYSPNEPDQDLSSNRLRGTVALKANMKTLVFVVMILCSVSQTYAITGAPESGNPFFVADLLLATAIALTSVVIVVTFVWLLKTDKQLTEITEVVSEIKSHGKPSTPKYLKFVSPTGTSHQKRAKAPNSRYHSHEIHS